VVSATRTRRYLAYTVDLLPVAAAVAAAARGSAPLNEGGLLAWAGALSVVLYLGVQLGALLVRGRTLGRLLLRLRTVDDATGMPLRLRRSLHLARFGRQPATVTADLRLGRDPVEPALADLSRPPEQPVVAMPTAVPTLEHEDNAPPHPTRPQPNQAAPSVSIMLANGERYEIFRSLLLGRSPTDVTGLGGHALLAWPDLSRRLAKSHALLEWSGSVLWVTDLHTVTGTTVTPPGQDRRTLPAGVRTAVPVGSSIECGGRSLKVVPSG
jgi:hypothetical protein